MLNSEIMTRLEVAELLRVSARKLSHWGPPRLPAYSRPAYSRAVVESWIREQEAAACSSLSAATFGGADSNTTGNDTLSRQVKEIITERRKLRERSELRLIERQHQSDPRHKKGGGHVA